LAKTRKTPGDQRQTKTAYFIEHSEVCCPRHVEAATSWSFILSRTGTPYSDEAVQRDVQALRNSGFSSM